MIETRIEKDTFGPIEVPAERLWGAQTQRSLHHFHISTERMPQELIVALAMVKRACALVNYRKRVKAACSPAFRAHHAHQLGIQAGPSRTTEPCSPRAIEAILRTDHIYKSGRKIKAL